MTFELENDPTSTSEDPKGMKPLMTIADVARVLGLAERTVYKKANDSESEFTFFFKVGGSWRAREADLESWIEQRVSL